jgi:hypothetical protein
MITVQIDLDPADFEEFEDIYKTEEISKIKTPKPAILDCIS